jgi:hypothetical protein
MMKYIICPFFGQVEVHSALLDYTDFEAVWADGTLPAQELKNVLFNYLKKSLFNNNDLLY